MVASCELRVASYELRVAGYGLRPTYDLLRLACFLFLIGRARFSNFRPSLPDVFKYRARPPTSLPADAAISSILSYLSWSINSMSKQYMSCARSSPIDPLQIVKN
ncbi:MAG TPA: hypothetical protein VF020_10030 [Chthoniobacterales bacterium]